MSSIKPKRYCRITLYIEQKDRQLAEAIDKVCLFGKPFSPSRDDNGVTFLYPDKKTRDDIVKAATEDPELAHKMIRSLIIRGYFPNPSSWNDVVANQLSQSVNITNKDGKTVTFSNNSTATVARDFSPAALGREGKPRLAVYNLVGPMSLDGPDAKDVLPTVTTKAGGYDYEEGTFNRGRFMRRLQSDYTAKIFDLGDDGKPVHQLINPYLEKLVSLLGYIEVKHPDLYPEIMTLVDPGTQASMYILLEPYKNANYLLDEAVLNGWKEAGYPKVPGPVNVFQAHFDRIKNCNGQDISFCIDRINNLRKELMNGGNCTPWKLAQEIVNVYKNNAHNYKIIKVPYLLKLQQDEIRLVLQTDFEDIESRRRNEVEFELLQRGELRGLFKTIVASHALNNNSTDSLLLLQQYKYDHTFMPKGLFFDGSFAFLRSSAFLYHAVPSDNWEKDFQNGDPDNPANKGKIDLFSRRMGHIKMHHMNRSMSKYSIFLQVRGLIAGDATLKQQFQDILDKS